MTVPTASGSRSSPARWRLPRGRGSGLPYLVFLQGGPGSGAPRPESAKAPSWLERALEEYRVVMLDQRGTGRSTPVDHRTLARRGDAAAQAAYLRHFRADAIVRDAEWVRRELVGSAPWTVLGQSYGGFCAVTYLSFAPEGLSRCSSRAGSRRSTGRRRTSTAPPSRACANADRRRRAVSRGRGAPGARSPTGSRASDVRSSRVTG